MIQLRFFKSISQKLTSYVVITSRTNFIEKITRRRMKKLLMIGSIIGSLLCNKEMSASAGCLSYGFEDGQPILSQDNYNVPSGRNAGCMPYNFDLIEEDYDRSGDQAFYSKYSHCITSLFADIEKLSMDENEKKQLVEQRNKLMEECGTLGTTEAVGSTRYLIKSIKDLKTFAQWRTDKNVQQAKWIEKFKALQQAVHNIQK